MDLRAQQFQQTGVSGKFPGRTCASRHRHNAEEELQSTSNRMDKREEVQFMRNN